MQKITYTKVGGDIGMINIDPDTGAITYNRGNAFGKVKIRATADDDPSTGNDNYNPSFCRKRDCDLSRSGWSDYA